MTSPGFAGGLVPGRRPAVLAIDMVRAYFEPDNAFCLPASDVLQHASHVIDAARESGVPVIHTRVEYGPDHLDGGLFVQKIPALRQFVRDAPAGAISDEVAPRVDELVVVKQYASAFEGTSVGSTLRALDVDTVVIIGVSTSGCVRATAVDALSAGLVPIVVADATADRTPEKHRNTLEDIGDKYGEVMSASAALDYVGSIVGRSQYKRGAD